MDRYANVHPWANNRIHLKVPDGHSTYVNASPITLTSPIDQHTSTYIAMQGPKDATIPHVWRMIWHEVASPAVIVMLTDTHEAGSEKCALYFPRHMSAPTMTIPDAFDDGFAATVTLLAVESSPTHPGLEARKMRMSVEGVDETKDVWHLLYTQWPDFSVPAGADLSSFLALMALSNSKNTVHGNPRIVHCSAGIGRSGTFIALDYLLRELQVDALGADALDRTSTNDAEVVTNAVAVAGSDDDDKEMVKEDREDQEERDVVFETVNLLREQRRTMVQADVQFFFIYDVLRGLWEQKYVHGGHEGRLIVRTPSLEADGEVFT